MATTTTTLVDNTLSHRRWVGRVLRVPVSTGTFSGVVCIAVQLVACLALSWLLGGTEGFAPHWYYLPIIFAAVRFGVLGAFLIRFWSSNIRFAYFFMFGFRPYFGTFEAKAWLMLPLWFANEIFHGYLAHSLGVGGGVAQSSPSDSMKSSIT